MKKATENKLRKNHQKLQAKLDELMKLSAQMEDDLGQAFNQAYQKDQREEMEAISNFRQQLKDSFRYQLRRDVQQSLDRALTYSGLTK